jgi:hypothetical protein
MCLCNRERTHWSHDQTRSVRIYSDAVFTELESWKAVSYDIVTEKVGYLLTSRLCQTADGEFTSGVRRGSGST